VSPNGCVGSKGFKTAKVKYTVSKNGLPLLNGNIDACKEIDNTGEEARGILQMFGIPDKCPVKAVSGGEE
jgi:hypothetical protein